MNKGQIFSIDFLISIILLVLFLGLIINAIEIKTNQTKETFLQEKIITESKVAFDVLTNGKYACKLDNGNILGSSLNENLLNSDLKENVKEYLAISDKKVNLKVFDNPTILNDNLIGETIINIEREILVCENVINFADLNNCLKGENCALEKKIVTLGVTK